jgi:signal transduction histidine kinase
VKRSAHNDDVVLAAIEREQQRIGAQLHEKVCQTLAGISIQAGLLAHRAQGEKPIAAADIEQLTQHIQEAIEQARTLSNELRAPALQGTGLLDALGHLAEITAHDVPCEYICERPVFVRDGQAALALFRIAEESVRNAVEHAEPGKIVISLRRSANAIELEVRDDGRGFEVRESGGDVRGIGLMYRYARAAGARLKIESAPGRGTRVACTLPQSG